MLLALALLVGMCGCGGATSTPASEAGTPSQPASTGTPSGDPASPDASHPPADVVGTFTGHSQLEGGCAWVTDAEGTTWEIGILPDGHAVRFVGAVPVLIGPDGQVIARGGDRIGLNGMKDPPDLGSICMVGRIFVTEEIAWVDRR